MPIEISINEFWAPRLTRANNMCNCSFIQIGRGHTCCAKVLSLLLKAQRIREKSHLVLLGGLACLLRGAAQQQADGSYIKFIYLRGPA